MTAEPVALATETRWESNDGGGDDDDDLQLSSPALEALNQFFRERDEQATLLEEVRRKAVLDEEAARGKLVITMDAFAEDWQHSQFWYDDATAEAFAEELCEGATEVTNIAIVSAPSVFVKIQEMKAAGLLPAYISPYLLEYDQRFSVFDRFVPYDFEQPLKLPADLKHKFDRVFLDPPFLSQDCQTKSALTVRWLLKSWSSGVTNSGGAANPRLIVTTGERVAELLGRLYRGVGMRATNFAVRHRKGLANEFLCYASFQSPRLRFLDPDGCKAVH